MGNREDLVAGAKRCLAEKGYARTTARDIAAASGVSLAAIGYHFGAKEALLTEALLQMIAEWGEGLSALSADGSDFETAWTRVLESFAASGRLWAIQFEILAHLEQKPELRMTFTEANRNARLGLAELFRGTFPADAGVEPEQIGAFYQVLLAGLAAVWLSDPDSAPSAGDLLAAMRAIGGQSTGVT
jgi:AcrR family transcriptional regulator